MEKEILNILVCAECRGKLEKKEETIVCLNCGLVFPIENGIPVMMINKARREN